MAPKIKRRRLTAIRGGREAFDSSHATIAVAARAVQLRFAEALDRMGPSGRFSADPFHGKLTLRDHAFRAEQLGSFDGASWIWAWANSSLALPEERTTISRALRDAAERLGVAAFSVPEIVDADEQLPHLLGDFAVAHGFGDGYYVAHSHVFVVAPGQIEVQPTSTSDLLARAIEGARPWTFGIDFADAVGTAARRLGMEVLTEQGDLVARGPEGEGGELRIGMTRDGEPFQKLAVCFVRGDLSMSALREHLAGGEIDGVTFVQASITRLDAEGTGWAVRITSLHRQDLIAREWSLLKAQEASDCTRAVVLEFSLAPSYEGTVHTIVSVHPSLPRSWAPAGGGAMVRSNGEVASAPFEAVAICERLNVLDDVLVYDTILEATYPR